jgi:hypothetical protein
MTSLNDKTMVDHGQRIARALVAGAPLNIQGQGHRGPRAHRVIWWLVLAPLVRYTVWMNKINPSRIFYFH